MATRHDLADPEAQTEGQRRIYAYGFVLLGLSQFKGAGLPTVRKLARTAMKITKLMRQANAKVHMR